jgi:hypothetical protein
VKVAITIELPANHGIAEARVIQNGTELEPRITPSNNKIVFEDTLDAGDYFINIHLYNTGGDRYGWNSTLSALSLAEALTWIKTHATEGDVYTITLSGDLSSLSPIQLDYNKQKVSITLDGGDSEQTLILTSNGSLFTLENGVT